MKGNTNLADEKIEKMVYHVGDTITFNNVYASGFLAVKTNSGFRVFIPLDKRIGSDVSSVTGDFIYVEAQGQGHDDNITSNITGKTITYKKEYYAELRIDFTGTFSNLTNNYTYLCMLRGTITFA